MFDITTVILLNEKFVVNYPEIIATCSFVIDDS